MFIEDRYDPRKILLFKEKIEQLKRGNVPIPVCVEVDVADGYCNQNCKDCSFESGPTKPLRLINSSMLLNTLEELSAYGVKSIEWVGGSEPTLHPEISLLISFSRKLGLKNGVITNGALLHKIFSNLVNGDLEYARISLDAITPETYQLIHKVDHFNQVVGNIKDALAFGVKSQVLGISFRITKENIGEISETARIIRLYGVSNIQYKYSFDDKGKNFQKLEVDLLKKELQKAKEYETATFSVVGVNRLSANQPSIYGSGCVSSPFVGVITAGGDIPFCIRYRNQSKWHLGNIKDGFMKCWEGQKHKDLLARKKEYACSFICKHHRYNSILREYCDEDNIPFVTVMDGIEINPYFL